jgi:uncharacterized protein
MQVRKPNLGLEGGKLIWSPVPEFAMIYNGASVAIPQYEYYLNGIIARVRMECCDDNPALKEELDIFIKQEAVHAMFHKQFNKRIFDTGIEALNELVSELNSSLTQQAKNRSLAFNAAFCAGFETVATFGSQYLYEMCDQFYEGGDAQGVNLVLWHVAEEFEHRASAHRAFGAASGNYFMRIYGMTVAFLHVLGYFGRGEKILLQYLRKDMTAEQLKASKQLAKKLFWRQITYLAPRMLKIVLPGYDPAKIKVPPRVAAALIHFQSADPITKPYHPDLARKAA